MVVSAKLLLIVMKGAKLILDLMIVKFYRLTVEVMKVQNLNYNVLIKK